MGPGGPTTKQLLFLDSLTTVILQIMLLCILFCTIFVAIYFYIWSIKLHKYYLFV